jgi:hypothetical protein
MIPNLVANVLLINPNLKKRIVNPSFVKAGSTGIFAVGAGFTEATAAPSTMTAERCRR